MSNSKIKIAFVFPGYGSQWKRMGAGLLEEKPFRTAIQECDKQFSMNKYVDYHIEEEIQKPVETSKMEDTLVGYPCSLAIEIALVELLKSWGIRPDGVIGHSGGEVPAAYTAGILNLKETFNVIWNHYMEMKNRAGKGMMAHISLPVEKLHQVIKEQDAEHQVFVAAQNSPQATIVSGESKAINKFLDSLTKKKIFCRPLNTLASFHSPLMEQGRNEIYNRIKDIKPVKASIPVYSSLNGKSGIDDVYDQLYWTDHMIKPVKFTRGIRSMINDDYTIFVEISPHPVLTRNIREILEFEKKGNCFVLSTLKRDEDEKKEIFHCLAHLSIAGCPISLERLRGEDNQRLHAAIVTLATKTKQTADSQHSPDWGLIKALKAAAPGKQQEIIIQMVKESIREATDNKIIPPLDIDMHLGFFDMGINSITAVQLKESISNRLQLPLPTTLIFDYPDLHSLSHYLCSLVSPPGLRGIGPGDISPITGEAAAPAAVEFNYKEPIAIIGMSCRFPGGANNPDAFWDLLKNGKNTVSNIPKNRWDADMYYGEEIIPGKSITRRGNFISGIDITGFDASFFNISPKEAKSLDPQQRLLLEVSVEALEHAAVPLTSIRGQDVGVFIGMYSDDYKNAHLHSGDLSRIDPYSGSGSLLSPAAGRISYFLGTRGPSVVFDTACSSALTALHFAVQSLRNRDCHMALTGGVNCLLSPHMYVYLTQLNTLSKDGTCKTFDEKADGFGRGEGCGIAVLKRLSDAQQDNDHIYALIKGTAINHDGASTGFTAPSGIAQQEVIGKALANSGVSPGSVDYIEAHGAGTSLGDPIEIGAIHQVYGCAHSMENPVLVGSVKTNIGHLEGAAGVAGLIKTVLSLHHQALPPHIRMTTPNPLIPWEQMPVKVNTQLTSWKPNEKPRRAGISSFGFSGTNAHVIIEEPPLPQNKTTDDQYKFPVHMLNLSAKSENALIELAKSYHSYLSQKCPVPGIRHICYTASTGRSHFNYRFSFAGKNRAEITRGLETFLSNPPKNIHSNLQKNKLNKDRLNKKIVFLFTGQGSQYPGMAKELYEADPVFKAELEMCDRLFYKYIQKSIIQLLYSGDSTGKLVDEALHAQSIIFSVEYALSKLWQCWGVEPSLVIGHSIGEYAAACTAGILTLEDAVKLVALRGKFMQSITEPGQMVGILTGEENIRAFIAPYNNVSIAAVNAPENVTLSGAKASMEKVIKKIKQAKIFIEPLNISHPFHSIMMEPYVEKFSREIEGVVFSPPQIPIISTITGGKVETELSDPGYWTRHICRPVRFYDGMKLAWHEDYQIYIEIGGTAALAGLASQCIPGGIDYALFLPSLRKGKNACEQITTTLSQLYLRGIEIHWKQFYKSFKDSNGTGRGPLFPTYPFQRETFWLDILPPHSQLPRETKSTAPDQLLVSATPPASDTEKQNNIHTIRRELAEMAHPISGLDPETFDKDTELLSLGFDSLMLAELRRKIIGSYGISIPLNEFFMEITTLDKISRYINRQLPESQRKKESIHELESGGGSLKGSGEVRTAVLKPPYYPMSSAQKRLYALIRVGEGERAYHVPMALRIQGLLEITKVESAFKELIRRHEALRTGLEMKDLQMVQRLYEPPQLEFSVTHRKMKESQFNLQQLIDEALQPFDLSRPPLMRVIIAEISPTHFSLITNFHHCIMDGTSLTYLIRDFLELYRGNTLTPLKQQFKDYVEWEQEYDGSAEFYRHQAFWVKQLGGEPPRLELPMDFPRPETMDFSAKTLIFKIGSQKTAKIKKLARETGTTLNMLLLAIYNVLLFKLTGQEDIVVGIPVNVRGYEAGDIHQAVGMFMNTMVMRNYPLGKLPFSRFLQEVKVNCIQAYAHQDYPFEALVRALDIKPDTSRNPLIDAAFVYAREIYSLYKLPGLTFTPCDLDMGASAFDLVLDIIEETEYLYVMINYRTTLFKEETIKQWKQFFERLIDKILMAPDTRLSAVDILEEREKQRLLQDFNDTSTDYPKDKMIHELFEQQVEMIPDNVALVGKEEGWKVRRVEGGSHLSYKELNNKSNQLAYLLHKKGVVPDTIVGIMVERSVEMIIGLLGILKAGGAYLPIEPGYPEERIAYMLKDSSAKILLKDNDFTPEVFNICPKGASSHLHLPPATCLAYVIYTSGTTGKPKGNLTTHYNVNRLVRNTNYIEITKQDRILQLSNYAFDGSVFDIYGSLLNGAALVIISKEDILSPEKLPAIIEKEVITVFFVTTALFNLLVEEKIECFDNIRKVLFGGERVSVDISRKALEYLGKNRILHVYGPTETTVYATYYPINKIDKKPITIPIGQPISNTLGYILDKYLNPAPIMVYGELYIGGDGVARGYLNNPELTAERFLPDFYRSYKSYMSYNSHMSYIYKTGDIARWLPDGNIEFLGRIDQQVKIRGYRIEPGEIVNHLLKQKNIKEAVVVPRVGSGTSSSSDKYLCAYIVITGTSEPGTDASQQLKEYLSDSLPGYMIPSYFVRLDQIPLTINGKIDFTALPEPEKRVPENYAAPGDAIEKKLVEIWAEVLAMEAGCIGVNTGFFDLGGQSLKATAMLSRVHKEFNTRITLSDISREFTIRKMAVLIRESDKEELLSIRPVEEKNHYHLSAAQRQLFFIYQMDPQSVGYNMPVFTKLEQSPDREKIAGIFQQLIRRHGAFRTSFAVIEQEPVQKIHKHVDFKIQYHEVTGIEPGTVHPASIVENFVRPFDLSHAPLIRVGVLKTGESDFLLMVDMHHIVSDARSNEIIIEEFIDLWTGETLPILKLQYKDFAQWQCDLQQSGVIKKQEDYWKQQFGGPVPVLEIPTDFPRPKIKRYEGNTFYFQVDKEQAEKLKMLAKKENLTLYMVLLAIYNIFLFKLSGQENIIVGTNTAGRRHPDLDPIIGYFINTLALWNYPRVGKTFIQFLREVGKRTLEAFDNQDYPFDQLVNCVVKRRDPSRNPLFDVLFSFNAQVPQTSDTEPLSEEEPVETVESENKNQPKGQAKFDITFTGSALPGGNLALAIEYCTFIFKEETIQRFSRYIKKIITSVTDDENINLEDIVVSHQLSKADSSTIKDDDEDFGF